MNPIEEEQRTKTEELMWSLLDEQISDEEFEQFQHMLATDEQIRELHLQSVQMHVDLHDLLGGHHAPGVPPIHGLPIAALDLPFPQDDGYLTDLT